MQDAGQSDTEIIVQILQEMRGVCDLMAFVDHEVARPVNPVEVPFRPIHGRLQFLR
jgi:hypothetical protein